MEELVPKKEKEVVNMMSPLIWAYIGDSVYELYIRTYLINTTNYNAHKLHMETIRFVKAKAQAEAVEKIKDKLTEEEKEILRRARNTKNHHIAKNAEVAEYSYATALEGLIGYLYLLQKEERIKEIMTWIIEKK